jgi:hypothetical protein
LLLVLVTAVNIVVVASVSAVVELTIHRRSKQEPAE